MIRPLLITLLCSVLLSGCNQVRKVTYPKDFVYLGQTEIKSKMALMSFYLRQIDEILLDDSEISSEQQRKIVGIVSKIEANVKSLGADGVRTNHLVIDDHIDQFKAEVTVALRDASASPPSYFALGRLSGSCLACHQHRKF